MICKVLTIAGSDCSGGAGVQADLKTMAAHKVYGMSAITALTAQNTTGVFGVLEASPEFVAQQIDCVFDDIRPDAVKIGMVSSAAIISTIAARLKAFGARNVVVDPVMVATSGSRLLDEDATGALRGELLPLGTVITPNIPEAEALCGFAIADHGDMERAARRLAAGLGGAVLIKGGHLTDCADDLLLSEGRLVWLNSPRLDNPNTHGTGCTLSSAIACHLAMGRGVEESVRRAKAYVTGALRAGLDLGRGSGPLDHAWAVREAD
ncbi:MULTISPECIES: bifunctional hydroxymethylpyrimidine kinase/phosphomethylpyrimidine kinase [unclassified Pyramidobacter]|uniref:bifunctional hydroxymethylpyrimidine kinase/phosphomethylpyrimidine kinase n=1 Tax=unclassified Pyramidobacter TaxID=2632171 RepID=UPI000EA34E7C|nr:bifunctional hydroxymethylpyrimidine kinase/phosphomethylpyrimidine kinase [Pyramidobacter sp. CG50-2]RKJ76456.1 bifunctional hydroxymethylpyrimidine kinase/phosphomethylpyrimidine kinase [Pyramidobacter sp. CG50-2]